MSGLFIEILDLNSSNLFDRESTLLYQHLSNLQLKVVDAPPLYKSKLDGSGSR